MLDHYLDNWHHVNNGGESMWAVLAPEYSALDVGSSAQSGDAPSAERSTRPGCIFSIPHGSKPPEGAELLGSGDPRELKPESRLRIAWESLAGYRPQGDTLDQWILDHLINGADPRGESAVKPLMPGRRLAVWFGKERISNQRFDFASDHHRLKMLEVLRIDNASRWEHEQGGDPNRPVAGTTQRVLDYQCAQYGIAKANYKELLPTDLRDHVPPPIRHATTIGPETFDQSNSTTLGPVFTWSEVLNDSQTISNSARPLTLGLGCWARAGSDLSGANHFAECDVTIHAGTNPHAGPVCRFSASAHTAYSYIYSGSNSLVLAKVVTGSVTQLENDSVSAYGLPLVLQCSAGQDGTSSTIRGYANGVMQASQTDTGVTGHTRIGFRIRGDNSANSALDDLHGEDYAAAGSSLSRRRLGLVQYASNHNPIGISGVKFL